VVLVAVFGGALLLSVLLSGVAARTVLSTSLVFLGAGMLLGPGFVGLIDVQADEPLVQVIADLALVTVLFTDGLRLGLRDIARAGRAPVRALFIGMPLTVVGIAVLVGLLTPLSWPAAFLVGAVLSPTDPVFASAIIGRREVPFRLRRLLSVESGLNDGLALPLVLIILASLEGTDPHPLRVLGELGLGLVVGLVIPLIVAGLFRLPLFEATAQLQPLGPLAVGILLYAVSDLTSANAYLAAFLGGATVATLAPAAQRAFETLGEQLSELVKFLALLLFGALLTPELFTDVGWGAYVVAVLALLVVRPTTFVVSLLGEHIPRKQLWTAAWFGPKGFASVVYGLIVLSSGDPEALRAFEIIALCVAVSIVAHSSTDVPIGRMFDVDEPEDGGRPAPDDQGTRA
jgi:sodium/hydrogen antiporter